MERLPECLLLRILVSVPLQHVFRLRVVCKAWNALLRSTHVLQTLALHSQRHLHLPCFAFAPLPLPVSPHSRLLLYSPYLGTWLHTHFPIPSSSAPASTPFSVMLFAAHGNLVAITPSTPTPRRIHIFNLLTSSQHDIIPPLATDPQFSSLSMFPLERSLIVSNLFIFCHDADGSSGQSYDVILVEQSPAHHTLLIYTSKTDSWKSASVPSQFRSLQQWIYSRDDFPKSDAEKADICFWNPTRNVDSADLVFWNSRESMITEYHVERNEWKNSRVLLLEFEAETGDQSMQKAYLAGGTVFKCQEGRVILVCADVMDERLSQSSPLMWRQIKGFRVWELRPIRFYSRIEPSMYEWVHVAHSPHSFWEGYYVEYTELKFKPKFIYDGTSICMTSAKHTGSQQTSGAFSHNKLGRYKPPLVYNLDLHSWSHLHRYGDEAEDLVGLFVFKPVFTALAQNNTALM